MLREIFSIIRRSFNLLSKTDRKKLIVITFAQTLLSLLDAVAVALIGILGALSISGIQSQAPGNLIGSLLELMKIEDFSFKNQVAILALLSSGLFLTRTMLSIYFTSRTLGFLAIRAAKFTADVSRRIFSQDYAVLKSYPKQEIVMHLTGGINSLIVGILGSAVLIFTDSILILIMLISIVLVEPYLALTCIVYFFLIGALLQHLLGSRAENLSNMGYESSIKASQAIINTLDTFRELFLRSALINHITKIELTRIEFAKISSKMALLPYIGKYVIETSIILGVLILTTQQIISNDAAQAAGILSVFLAAAFRIAPSILRLQQGLMQVKFNNGSAKPVLEMYLSLLNLNLITDVNLGKKIEIQHKDFNPSITINNLFFSYPNSHNHCLKNISFSIEAGMIVSIVGRSGVGKSTLADLILGVSKPQQGTITISGVSPNIAVDTWPGAIAYVPQNVCIINGTICQNITLNPGPVDSANRDQVWNALESAQLKHFVTSLDLGLETVLSDGGLNLSGGQRQRLAIARALYTKPKIILMDESSSALDIETELLLNKSIQELRGKVTVIQIAHRLSTIKNSDLILYMDDSKIKAKGTFDEIRALVPDFEMQISLQEL
jgi:ATP-binding cassette, subfamily B, bacterial PglK